MILDEQEEQARFVFRVIKVAVVVGLGLLVWTFWGQ